MDSCICSKRNYSFAPRNTVEAEIVVECGKMGDGAQNAAGQKEIETEDDGGYRHLDST